MAPLCRALLACQVLVAGCAGETAPDGSDGGADAADVDLAVLWDLAPQCPGDAGGDAMLPPPVELLAGATFEGETDDGWVLTASTTSGHQAVPLAGGAPTTIVDGTFQFAGQTAQVAAY
jgi:hypothetical protein